jgi:signal transduction histidine kinase/CheY-like chemotaxis protein
MELGKYSVGWDGLMTAYAPMFAEDGTVFAVAGVDLDDVTIVRIMKQNRDIQIIFIAELIAVIVVGAFLIWIMHRRAEEFNKVSRVKSDFLSRMSHEMRTPMNAITGLLRMASESKDIPTIHRYIANISISSNFLLSLINDILDISKIEAGKMSLEKTTIRLPVLIDTIRRMLKPQAMDKKIHLEFSLEEGLPDTIIADGVRLTQIIMNLIGNALKFTPEGGRIRLEVLSLGTDTPHHLEFRVTDNGIGIAPEYIDKLFDPFEQGAGSTTRKFGGTGLGLAISRRFVEMMGGHIHVRSVEGEGSTFIFDIYAEAPASELEASIEPSNAGNVIDLTGKRLLIVEDNDINQIIAESMFTSMGAEVVLAGNGQEGIDAFLAEPEGFDIIFMDLLMPVMDGIEAAKQIRKSGVPAAKTIPIIAMTANVFADDIERTRTAGMNAHLGKPFEIKNVIAAIKEVL